MHGPEKYPGFGTSQRTADGERAAWSSRVKNNREQPEERRASQGAEAKEYAQEAFAANVRYGDDAVRRFIIGAVEWRVVAQLFIFVMNP